MYGLPAIDLAHASLYTSTTWDPDVAAVLDRRRTAGTGGRRPPMVRTGPPADLAADPVLDGALEGGNRRQFRRRHRPAGHRPCRRPHRRLFRSRNDHPRAPVAGAVAGNFQRHLTRCNRDLTGCNRDFTVWLSQTFCVFAIFRPDLTFLTGFEIRETGRSRPGPTCGHASGVAGLSMANCCERSRILFLEPSVRHSRTGPQFR
jgi:hypothetical protein